ncbi:MAG: hypothetical protein GXO94_02920 [Nitrospirae bacterium]|nr:hypothetical protein [Nitrospirota bacterium]
MDGILPALVMTRGGVVNRMSRSFLFWQKWIVLMSCGGILTGLFLPLLSTIEAVSAGYNRAVAETFFGLKSMPEELTVYSQWMWGMLGAVIVAWSICILFLALYPFRRLEKWSFYCIGSSLVAGFAVDAGLSVYFGFYEEVAVATLWFVLGAMPMAATYRDFFHASRPNPPSF